MRVKKIPIKQIQQLNNIMVENDYTKTTVRELSGIQTNTITAILEGKNEFSHKTARKLEEFLQRQEYPNQKEIQYKDVKIKIDDKEIRKMQEVRSHVATYKELAKLTGLTTHFLYGLIGGIVTEVDHGNYHKIKKVIDLNYLELQELAIDKGVELETDKKKYRSKTSLEIGRKYRFTTKSKAKNLEIIEGTVIKEYEHYYVLHTGAYKTCVLKSDLLTNEFKIKKF